MRVFAISDLHLSACTNKPMDVFGTQWTNHAQRIFSAWRECIQADDIVLMPGDHSWGMTAAEAQPDLQSIAQLPGKKILLRGNHDYWWTSYRKVSDMLDKSMQIVQNNALRLGSAVICGTRGWEIPAANDTSSHDAKLYERERIRLQLSLAAAKKIQQTGDTLFCMMHYPPLLSADTDSGFSRLFAEYGVQQVVYGHLHGSSAASAVQGEIQGCHYHLVSCDYLRFSPLLICEL